MGKIITPQPRPLEQVKCHYGETLRADHIAVPAANAAWVNGMVRGDAYIDADGTTANPAPLNPHGRRGHDHSGGRFGVPLFRTLGTYWFERGARLSANWSGYTNDEDGFYYAFSGGANDSEQYRTRPFFVWPPNCDRGPWGAYNYLGAVLYVDVESTSLQGGGNDDEVTFRLRNLAPQFEGREVEFSLTDPTTAAPELFESGASSKLPVLPGVPNAFTIETDIDLHNSGGARGATISLVALEVGVYQTW